MLALVLWLIAYVASRGSPDGGNAVVRLLASSLIGVLVMLLLGPLGALLIFVCLLRRKALGPTGVWRRQPWGRRDARSA